MCGLVIWFGVPPTVGPAVLRSSVTGAVVVAERDVPLELPQMGCGVDVVEYFLYQEMSCQSGFQ